MESLSLSTNGKVTAMGEGVALKRAVWGDGGGCLPVEVSYSSLHWQTAALH